MPKIINAYSGNDSIAGALSGLAESMFGDADKHELYRQSARDKSAVASGHERENAATEAASSAYRANNLRELAAQFIRAGRPGADAANYNLLGTAQNTKDVNDPSIGVAQLGAHEPFSATRAGQDLLTDRQRQTQIAIADRANTTQEAIAARNREHDERKYANEFVNMMRADGTIVPVQRSEVPSRVAEGYRIAPSLDIQKARMLEPMFSPSSPGVTTPPAAPMPPPSTVSPPAVPASVTTPAPPAAPAARPSLTSLTPDQRALVALPHTEQPYVNRQTGETAVSVDGGQTVRMPNGNVIATAGTPWVGIQPGERAALDRARELRTQVTADQPIDINGWENAGAGHAARKASDITTLFPMVWGDTLGHAQIGAPIARAFGRPSGQISEETTNARQFMSQLEKQLATAQGAYEGVRANKYLEEKQVASGPKWGVTTTAPDAVASVGNTINLLRTRDDNLRRAISDPTTPPAEMDKLHTAYRTNRELIQFMLSPYGPAAVQQGGAVPGAQPAAAPAAASAGPAVPAGWTIRQVSP